MSGGEEPRPPPPYEELYPPGQPHGIYCIYNPAFEGDDPPPYDGATRMASLVWPHPPDYCDQPPPYSREDLLPQPPNSPSPGPPPTNSPPPGPPPTNSPPPGPPPPNSPSPGPPPPDPPALSQSVYNPPLYSIYSNSFMPRGHRPSYMIFSIINFILCPPLGIFPLLLSVMIRRGDLYTVKTYSSTVRLLNAFVLCSSLTFLLSLCLLLPTFFFSWISAAAAQSPPQDLLLH